MEPATVKLHIVSVFLLLLVCSLPSSGHIHSQKIRNYGGELVSEETWVLSLLSACLVGLCGVVPLFLNRWVRLDQVEGNSQAMQTVLSFAVGGLMGDVWLHLLPESWSAADKGEENIRMIGLWVIIGLFSFMLVEKVAKMFESGDEVSGYLNLIANCTDNFTHGLAIAASYIVSPLVGLLTTAAIICHEVPHEVGDFAILLRSGFSISNAIHAQLLTATGGILGVFVGLMAEQMGQCTTWMLPFTAGGFLYIAMVSIIPELVQEDSHPFRQLFGVLCGVLVMAAVTVIERKSCAAMPPTAHNF